MKYSKIILLIKYLSNKIGGMTDGAFIAVVFFCSCVNYFSELYQNRAAGTCDGSGASRRLSGDMGRRTFTLKCRFRPCCKKSDLKGTGSGFPPQPVITKDNVTMQIDTVVYFQITDPKLFTYGVENPHHGRSRT